MKMKIDLGQFKLKHNDGKRATLVHRDGHEFHIAVHALHPMNRKNLDAMEKHQGMNSGAASQSMPMKDGGDPSQQHLDKGDKMPNKVEKSVVNKKRQEMAKAFAKGGKVDVEPIGPTHPIKYEKIPPEHPVEAEPEKPLEVEELKHPEPKNPVEAEHVGPPEPKKQPVQYEPMAEGGKLQDEDNFKFDEPVSDELSDKSEPPAPDNTTDAPAPPGTNITINAAPPTQPQQPAATASQQTPPQPQMTGSAPPPPGSEQQPSSHPSVPSAQLQPVQNATPQMPGNQPVPEPSVQGAYEQGAQGIQAQSKAEQQLARDTAIQEQAKAKSLFDLHQQTMDTYRQMDQESKDLQQAVISQKIDPNRYMSSLGTGKRILAGIGMFFGGLGNSTALMDMLDKNIDRDIDAQKAELGKKQTLFSMNMQRFNNIKEAEEQTRLNMHDIAQANIATLTAKAQAPMAKARGQQLLAQYQAQFAPMLQQAALRQTLQGASQTGEPLSVDPAQLVPQMVPESARKEVLHEIGQSENARKNKIAFLQAFDNADKENSIGGRIARLGFTPPSIKAMDVLGLPLIHDLEGRVNEYEQKTLQDNYPQPGDKPETVAAKRQAITHFFDQKAAAPNAKAYGIDLDRFQSTSSQTPPSTQEVERIDPKSGKIAIFDANTKKFLRYK